jgi:hypothetical protein
MDTYSFQYVRRRAHVPAKDNPFKYKYTQEQDIYIAQGAWDVVYAAEGTMWSVWPLTQLGEKALSIGYVSKHAGIGGRFRDRPEDDYDFHQGKNLRIAEITLDQLNLYRKNRSWI